MAADALALAFAFINRRERTASEVRSRLEREDLPAAEIDAAVAELVELGYISDERYARLFTEDKRNLAGWGSERISRALSAKGVDRDLIAAALQPVARAVDELIGEPVEDPLGQPESELDRALEVLSQRFPEPPTDRRDRERAFAMLVRKGYESELAADAVRAWAANGSAVAPPPPRYYDA